MIDWQNYNYNKFERISRCLEHRDWLCARETIADECHDCHDDQSKDDANGDCVTLTVVKLDSLHQPLDHPRDPDGGPGVLHLGGWGVWGGGLAARWACLCGGAGWGGGRGGVPRPLTQHSAMNKIKAREIQRTPRRACGWAVQANR